MLVSSLNFLIQSNRASVFPIYPLKELENAFGSTTSLLVECFPASEPGLENVDSGYLVRADFGC